MADIIDLYMARSKRQSRRNLHVDESHGMTNVSDNLIDLGPDKYCSYDQNLGSESTSQISCSADIDLESAVFKLGLVYRYSILWI